MPQHPIKQLWFPFLLLMIPGALFALLLPYFPVDETRYLSVAWEMWLNDSFIVPIQNALPYAHKPPFLFWLFNLDWLVFGVNQATLRFIPLLFSLLNVTLVHGIALKLWDDARTARYAAIVLASTLSYLLWSSIIMFDVVLTFWVLLAVSGIVSAAKAPRPAPFLLTGVAIGFGILTKGPVVLVYILPAALLSFFWMPRENFSGRWYGWLALSLAVGIALLLLWLVPAALTGSESYRRAILWGQTVNRMANSFAHKRPFWWYLPWIPVLLMPWLLFAPAWKGWSRLAGDAGCRMVLTWLAGSLVVFSFLSGKQVHYLIPVLPTFSLLMARSIASCEEAGEPRRRQLPVAIFYLAAGAALLAASFLKHGHLLRSLDPAELRVAAAVLCLLGLAMALLRPRSMRGLLDQIAVSSLVLCVAVLIGGHTLFARYDLNRISQAVRLKQEQGFTVMHLGKYHGQFHFVGRLRHPLVELETREAVAQYAAQHDKVALVSYEQEDKPLAAGELFFRQPFRSKQVVLWNREGISRFVASPR